jgi:hypothetical protein
MTLILITRILHYIIYLSTNIVHLKHKVCRDIRGMSSRWMFRLGWYLDFDILNSTLFHSPIHLPCSIWYSIRQSSGYSETNLSELRGLAPFAPDGFQTNNFRTRKVCSPSSDAEIFPSPSLWPSPCVLYSRCRRIEVTVRKIGHGELRSLWKSSCQTVDQMSDRGIEATLKRTIKGIHALLAKFGLFGLFDRRTNRGISMRKRGEGENCRAEWILETLVWRRKIPSHTEFLAR